MEVTFGAIRGQRPAGSTRRYGFGGERVSRLFSIDHDCYLVRD
jgi:hypothetical protein